MITDLIGAESDGLRNLRQVIANGEFEGMAKTLQFLSAEVEDGRGVFEALPGPHVYNPYGTVHGGYAASLLDSVCALAVKSKVEARQTLATLEMKVSFHHPMTAETGRVRAVGNVVSMSRRVAFAEGKLADMQGHLIASATATLIIKDGAASPGMGAANLSQGDNHD